MSYRINEVFEPEKVAMRDIYCSTLMDMTENDNRVVVLDADLANSIGIRPFAKKYPERFFNCGIQEANMMGIAAGLSATGKIPFAHTFAPFATRRVMDQIFVSIAYARLNVKIIGSDPGITSAYNGGTHMPFEDMAVMRSIPEMIVLEPTDATMFENLLRQLKDIYGAAYVRMERKNPYAIYKPGSTFKIGKGIVLREGKDVTVIASGIMVKEAIDAAVILQNEGISAKIVNMFTWKPIDIELILQCAEETGAIVTAENHNVMCGLGEAVTGVVSQAKPVPVEFVGVNDRFGQVGPQHFLRSEYKLTADEIVVKAKKVIERK